MCHLNNNHSRPPAKRTDVIEKYFLLGQLIRTMRPQNNFNIPRRINHDHLSVRKRQSLLRML